MCGGFVSIWLLVTSRLWRWLVMVVERLLFSHSLNCLHTKLILPNSPLSLDPLTHNKVRLTNSTRHQTTTRGTVIGASTTLSLHHSKSRPDHTARCLLATKYTAPSSSRRLIRIYPSTSANISTRASLCTSLCLTYQSFTPRPRSTSSYGRTATLRPGLQCLFTLTAATNATAASACRRPDREMATALR
jgi:hypothetical protein